MKRIGKYLLILLLVLMVLVGSVVTYVAVKGIPRYEAGNIELTVEPTPARVVQGEKLASMLCIQCHLDPQTNQLTGQFSADLPGEFGKIYSQNITHHPFYGIGKWTDGQLMYFLRTGIRPDGSFAPLYMPKFVLMADEDLKSVIAWLRSDDPRLKASSDEAPASDPSLLVKFLTNFVLKAPSYPEQEITVPDTTDKIAYGRYIAVSQIGCYACHSKDFTKQDPFFPEKSLGFFGGGNEMRDRDGKLIYSSNITPDKETGIGNWTEEQFIRAVKYGQTDRGALSYPMIPHTKLTNYELSCVFDYLKTVPPIVMKTDR